MTKFAIRKNLMRGCTLVLLTSVAAVTLSTSQAKAVVINFDDLSSGSPIPNGYQGFNWDNFYTLSGSQYVPSGYNNGTVSNPNVAYNAYGFPASVSINNSQFDFNSAYLTSAWNNGLNIVVEGFLNGVTKYSQTVTVDSTSATLFNFNFLGIDNLRFTSFGGINAGYFGSGEHFALDNFTYNQSANVPEPVTILGTLTAAGFGVILRRKQKQQQKAIAKA